MTVMVTIQMVSIYIVNYSFTSVITSNNYKSIENFYIQLMITIYAAFDSLNSFIKY